MNRRTSNSELETTFANHGDAAAVTDINVLREQVNALSMENKSLKNENTSLESKYSKLLMEKEQWIVEKTKLQKVASMKKIKELTGFDEETNETAIPSNNNCDVKQTTLAVDDNSVFDDESETEEEKQYQQRMLDLHFEVSLDLVVVEPLSSLAKMDESHAPPEKQFPWIRDVLVSKNSKEFPTNSQGTESYIDQLSFTDYWSKKLSQHVYLPTLIDNEPNEQKISSFLNDYFSKMKDTVDYSKLNSTTTDPVVTRNKFQPMPLEIKGLMNDGKAPAPSLAKKKSTRPNTKAEVPPTKKNCLPASGWGAFMFRPKDDWKCKACFTFNSSTIDHCLSCEAANVTGLEGTEGTSTTKQKTKTTSTAAPAAGATTKFSSGTENMFASALAPTPASGGGGSMISQGGFTIGNVAVETASSGNSAAGPVGVSASHHRLIPVASGWGANIFSFTTKDHSQSAAPESANTSTFSFGSETEITSAAVPRQATIGAHGFTFSTPKSAAAPACAPGGGGSMSSQGGFSFGKAAVETKSSGSTVDRSGGFSFGGRTSSTSSATPAPGVGRSMSSQRGFSFGEAARGTTSSGNTAGRGGGFSFGGRMSSTSSAPPATAPAFEFGCTSEGETSSTTTTTARIDTRKKKSEGRAKTIAQKKWMSKLKN